MEGSYFFLNTLEVVRYYGVGVREERVIKVPRPILDVYQDTETYSICFINGIYLHLVTSIMDSCK